MRIFKTRTFQRWMKKTELTDALLCLAVDEMVRGLIDAELGDGVVKKRIALPGRGKSGSTRTIVATNFGDRWVFLFGFEKNERENIIDGELKTFRLMAKELLSYNELRFDEYVSLNRLEEIGHGKKK